jgi:hypothetical protein
MSPDNDGQWGRPGDYVHPEAGFRLSMRAHDEAQYREQEKRTLIRGGLAFVAVLCLGSFIVVGALNQQVDDMQRTYTIPAEKTRTASAPIVLRKLTGTVSSIDDERGGSASNTRNYNFSRFIPMRYVTMDGHYAEFYIPKYVTLFLTEEEWRAARSVELLYYDEPFYRYQAQAMQDMVTETGRKARHVRRETPYYEAAGITIDGTTYLTPFAYTLLRPFWMWLLITAGIGWGIVAGIRRWTS